MEDLSWINNCFLTKDKKLMKPELRVVNFHKHLSSWCDKSSILANRGHRSMLALECFSTLESANRIRNTLIMPDDEDILTERDSEILEYIAGYLLYKVKKSSHALLVTALSPPNQQPAPESWTATPRFKVRTRHEINKFEAKIFFYINKLS